MFDANPLTTAFSLEDDLDEDRLGTFLSVYGHRFQTRTSDRTAVALRNLHLIGTRWSVLNRKLRGHGCWPVISASSESAVMSPARCSWVRTRCAILDRRDFHSDVYSMIDEVVAWILSQNQCRVHHQTR